MKKVIFIEQPKEETKKPVEFTHQLSTSDGWVKSQIDTSICDKIVYLGKCATDGDMFAVNIYLIENGHSNIHIYKGHLNSGEY